MLRAPPLSFCLAVQPSGHVDSHPGLQPSERAKEAALMVGKKRITLTSCYYYKEKSKVWVGAGQIYDHTFQGDHKKAPPGMLFTTTKRNAVASSWIICKTSWQDGANAITCLHSVMPDLVLQFCGINLTTGSGKSDGQHIRSSPSHVLQMGQNFHELLRQPKRNTGRWFNVGRNSEDRNGDAHQTWPPAKTTGRDV
ncbi:unnamed protein product [Hydatigera taeniaeformis]|uniref:WH1 domain-containing protein n=1 Tax=Hydatigena taeniaeformis TaxID=6205 RepID=A0A0R3X4G9_HYDTA|nr:unnamed protein product [Hydatigera taeniaeformis]